MSVFDLARLATKDAMSCKYWYNASDSSINMSICLLAAL